MVEFSAWLSARSTEFIDRFAAVPQASLERYWAASRRRWAGWMQDLKAYPVSADAVDRDDWEVLWKHTRALMAEVLATEPLTRLWGPC